MSQRINITVPDDLFNELQGVKDNINVSGICQKAISREISREKAFKNATDDKSKLIVRLKKEREEFAQRYKEVGYKHGVNNAKTMYFEDIWKAELFQDAYSPKYIFEAFATHKLLEQVKQETLPDLPDGVAGDFDTFNEFQDLYFDGWLSGVLDVWSDVKGKLTNDGRGDFLDVEEEEEDL